MTQFKVGDEVTLSTRRDGARATVEYGPFDDRDVYVVKLVEAPTDPDEIRTFTALASVLKLAPKFAIGDKVTSYGDAYTILAGQFQGYTEWYAAEDESGKAFSVNTDEMLAAPAPKPEPIKVGDRVRVVRAFAAEHRHGETGVVTSTTEEWRSWSDDVHPYSVMMDSTGGELYVAELERIDEPADTYEYDGVTYDLSAKYRDGEGDVWSFTGKRIRGVPTVTMSGNLDNADTVEDIADAYGLTRVTD